MTPNRGLLLAVSLVIVLVPRVSRGEDDADKPQQLELFADKSWYQQQPGDEQAFEGVIERADRGGAFGFGRFNPFRLKMAEDTREVYMGGQLKALQPYVGKRVRLRGKAVEMEVEGQRHREIWPAELSVLPQISVLRQATFVIEDDPEAGSEVFRSADELDEGLAKAVRAAANGMQLDDIDFTKNMVVLVQSGRTNSFGVRVTIDSIELDSDKKSATVHWTYRPYFGGAAPPEEFGNCGAIAVVGRFDGQLKFTKHIYQWPKDLPLPPSAAPSLSPRPERLPE